MSRTRQVQSAEAVGLLQRDTSPFQGRAKASTAHGAVVVLAAFVLAALAVMPTARVLWDYWLTPGGPFGHGLVGLGFFTYAVVRRADVLQPGRSWFHLITLPALVGAYVLWLVSSLSSVVALEFLLAFSLVCAATCSTIRDPKPLLIPLLVLSFGLPIWSLLNPPLQLIATQAVGLLVRTVGLPLFVSGNEITIPSGEFVIAGGCSGLGFLLASLSLATIFLYLERANLSQSIRFIVLAVLLALACNWIRITIIVLIGHYSDMQSSLVSDHIWLGWVVFFVLGLPVFWFASPRATDEPDAANSRSPATNPATRRSVTWSVFLLLVAASGATLWFSSAPERSVNIAVSADTLTFVAAEETGPWRPKFDGADGRHRFQVLGLPIAPVELLVVGYHKETQAAELITGENDFIRGLQAANEAAVNGTSRLAVTTRDGNAVVYWYRVGRQDFIDPVATKIAQVMPKLRGDHIGLAIALRTECHDSCDAAVQTLLELSRGLSVVATLVDVE